MPFSKRRKFGAIYADPPWSFRNWSAKGTGRNAISHYDCLDFKALASLPIADLAAENCALFLWATDPLLIVHSFCGPPTRSCHVPSS